MRRLRVVVVDGDAMARSWVRHVLEGAGHAVVQELADLSPRARLARRVDVLLIESRQLDGLRRLRRRGVAAPAVVMTTTPLGGFNEVARGAGAQGTLVKSASTARLLGTLRLVAEGAEAFDRRHPPRASGEASLTPREREVLRLVAAGATNGAIADELGVSRESVKTLLSRSFRKLGVRTRAAAVSAAHERGFL